MFLSQTKSVTVFISFKLALLSTVIEEKLRVIAVNRK